MSPVAIMHRNEWNWRSLKFLGVDKNNDLKKKYLSQNNEVNIICVESSECT